MFIENKRGFIINVVLVVALLAAVFLSQQPWAKELGKKWYGQVADQGSYYATNAQNWFSGKTNIDLGGGAEGLKASVTQEVARQKNNAAQSLWENIKTYLAGKFNGVFGTEVK